jgi:hypothetical protein
MTDKADNTHNLTPAAEPLALRLSERLGPNVTMPEPFDYCYEWDGPYGTRKFSAARHNGMEPTRSVPLFTETQMRAFALEHIRLQQAAHEAATDRLRFALCKLMGYCITDHDMIELGWDAGYIAEACDAYDAAKVALGPNVRAERAPTAGTE